MATVPGVPDNTIPKVFAPTQADMLMAMAIYKQQQDRFQTAMDVSGMRPSANIEDVRGKSDQQKMIEENEDFIERQQRGLVPRETSEAEGMQQEHRRMRRYRPEVP